MKRIPAPRLALLPVLAALTAFTAACSKRREPPLVAILMVADFRQPTVDGLIEGLAGFGYLSGERERTGNILYRIVNAKGDRAALRRLAKELVAQRPAVLCAVGGIEADACIAAARATGVPVIFAGLDNPVERGLAKSLLEPLPDTTGVRSGSTELIAKRMELAKLFFPAIKSVSVLYEPGYVTGEESLRLARRAGEILGLAVKPVPLKSDQDVRQFMESVDPEEHEMLLGTPSFLVFSNRKDVIAQGAIRAKVPFFGFDRQACREGAVLAYGSDFVTFGRQAAHLVRSVLEGAKADSLPIELASDIDLCVNLITAEKMDLTLPPLVVDLADFIMQAGVPSEEAEPHH